MSGKSIPQHQAHSLGEAPHSRTARDATILHFQAQLGRTETSFDKDLQLTSNTTIAASAIVPGHRQLADDVNVRHRLGGD